MEYAHADIHTSEATEGAVPCAGSSKGPSNDSRSLHGTILSNPAPCEFKASGSRSRGNTVRWSIEDCDVLLQTVPEFFKAGKCDHKRLLAKWDILRGEGLVSNAVRSADALFAKYRTAKAQRETQLSLVLNTSVVAEALPIGVDEEGDNRRREGVDELPETGYLSTRQSQDQVVTVMDTLESEVFNGQSADVPDAPIGNSFDLFLTNGIEREQEVRGESYGNTLSELEKPINVLNAEGLGEFFDEFDRNLNIAYSGRRVPLRVVRNKRIPMKLLQFGNYCIRDYPYDPVPLDVLNQRVYAAAKTIIDKVLGPKVESNKDWYEKNRQLRLILVQNLGRLKSIMDRLNASRPMTEHQRRNLSLLRRVYGRRYKLKTVAQMGVLYFDLTEHLSMAQRLFKAKVEETSRKRTRWAPLSLVLRKNTETSDTPVYQVRKYWELIIGVRQDFNMNRMLRGWERSIEGEVLRKEAPVDPSRETDLEIWKQVCQKARPWKAVGPDGIHSFWWKVFPFAKERLFDIIIDLRQNGANGLPPWIAHGRAVSLYKGKGNRKDPGNFPTIACLNTCYKLVTGVMARWISNEVRKVPLALPDSQLALKKGVWSTTHAHILDRTIVQDCVSRKRKLAIAWIDFSKAFDSIPHSYILWILKSIGIDGNIISLLSGLMDRWELSFVGFVKGRFRTSRPLKVLNGVLQGDTLSPLLFCLSVSPISHYLNTNLRKYTTSTGTIGGALTDRSLSINLLYYVDDLVIYIPEAVDLDQAVKDIELYAKDFGCRLNASKSAKYFLGSPRGDEARSHDDSNDLPTIVRARGYDDPYDLPTIRGRETYKYLGIDKSQTVDHKSMWRRIKADIIEKTKDIFGSELTFRQKVMAFNAVTIPKAKYMYSNEIFGSGRYESVLAEAKKFDKEIRTLLVTLFVRHRSSSVERLYLEPKQGGLGLENFWSAVYDSIVYTYCYATLRPELKTSIALMEILERRGKRTLLSDFRKTMSDHGLESLVVYDPEQLTLAVSGRLFTDPTKAARAISGQLRLTRQLRLLDEFKTRTVASQVLSNDQLEPELSTLWLQKGLVSSQVVNNVIASQEGQLLVKGHPSRRGMSQTCRLNCTRNGARETAEHIISVCSHWRTTLMVKRHNSVARNIYYALCVKYGFETRHYNQTIEGIRQNDSIVLYWDHPVITTKKVLHHRPDLVVVDHVKKTVTVVEVSVAWHTRLSSQAKRKYAKYAVNSTLPESHELNSEGTFPAGDNLACEIGRDMGYVVTVLPIVVGCLGEISKETLGYLEKLDLTRVQGVCLIERMARSAVIGSSILIKAHCSVPYT